MRRSLPFSCISAAVLACCAALGFAAALPAHADLSESIIYTFGGQSVSSEGGEPYANLVEASNGTLYGSTLIGGTEDEGTIYKISTGGSLTVLHNFGDGSVADDGEEPVAALLIGSDGNLYGTTFTGGVDGDGTVFKMTTAGAVTILHSFAAGGDGGLPETLTFGHDGKLYGTTSGLEDSSEAEYGTIYSLATDGSDYQVLFQLGSSNSKKYGETARGNLIPVSSKSSNFYGTTVQGGANGDGTLYELVVGSGSTASSLRVIHSFGASGDGQNPDLGGILTDSSGNIYGTTEAGGASGDGIVYKIAPSSGDETILHSFAGADGSNPEGGLMLASDGNYYGSTYYGGADSDGVVFKITPSGTETVVYDFGSSSTLDGMNPLAFPLELSSGSLIGVTLDGGDDAGNAAEGIVYELAAGLPNPVKPSKLAVSPTTVTGGSANSKGTVTLSMPAPSGGAIVTLTSSSTSAATVPTSVTVPANSEMATFTITSKAVTSDASVTITAAYNGASKTAKLTVDAGTAALKSVTLSPTSTPGGTSTTANRIYLTADATATTTVDLSSSNTAVATVPASETVGSGSDTRKFTIATKNVTTTQTVTITATYNGVSKTAQLTVTPAVSLKSVTLAASSAPGGTSLSGNRIYLTGYAASSASVKLSSSNTSIATVPSQETIAAGSSSHSFTIATSAVTAATTVTITASYNGVTKTATLTVVPSLSSVKVASSSVKGGTSLTGNRIYLTGNANANTAVTLTSSNTAVATVPSSETILSGSSSHSFTITTKAVTANTTVTITATSGGVTKTATLTVTP